MRDLRPVVREASRTSSDHHSTHLNIPRRKDPGALPGALPWGPRWRIPSGYSTNRPAPIPTGRDFVPRRKRRALPKQMAERARGPDWIGQQIAASVAARRHLHPWQPIGANPCTYDLAGVVPYLPVRSARRIWPTPSSRTVDAADLRRWPCGAENHRLGQRINGHARPDRKLVDCGRATLQCMRT